MLIFLGGHAKIVARTAVVSEGAGHRVVARTGEAIDSDGGVGAIGLRFSVRGCIILISRGLLRCPFR